MPENSLLLNGVSIFWLNEFPVFFVADDRQVWKEGSGRALGLTSFHELTELASSDVGELGNLTNDLGVFLGDIDGFSPIVLQVVEDWFPEVVEGLVFIPEGELFSRAR